MRNRAVWMGGFAVLLCIAAGWSYAADDEQEIAIADLPAAVVDAVKAKFPDATLVEAEVETENGKMVYEVEIEDDGQELEVEVSADGEILEVESDDDDDGEDDD